MLQKLPILSINAIFQLVIAGLVSIHMQNFLNWSFDKDFMVYLSLRVSLKPKSPSLIISDIPIFANPAIRLNFQYT